MLAPNQRGRLLEVRWELALITRGDALNRGAPFEKVYSAKELSQQKLAG